MQSFFQYRRFRRHLEQQINEHGLAATASVQEEFPFHALWECAEDKWVYTLLLGTTGFVVSGSSAFDTGVTPQAARYFGVKDEVQLLSTSLYMIALGLGSLISAPFSETVGRNPVYIICKHLRGSNTS